jgi:hypothetical protein
LYSVARRQIVRLPTLYLISGYLINAAIFPLLGNAVSLPASEILLHGLGIVVEVEQLHSGFCSDNF